MYLEYTNVELQLDLDIHPQPDEVTCGPTCLDAIYRYFGDELPLEQVIREIPQLETGGTLAVQMGIHALKRSYNAVIYTYNLQLFDPTWFHPGRGDLKARLQAQKRAKDSPKLHTATDAYLEFLELGGQVCYEDLGTSLIRRQLTEEIPILTGLSATYLYREARIFGDKDVHDDIRGEPCGHFVVLCGYSRMNREVLVADPLHTNPLFKTTKYWLKLNRVVGAILLGMITYDANLLVIHPKT